MARRANFLGVDVHFRLHALPGYLHEAKLGDGQYGMLGPVAAHKTFHCLYQFFLVIGQLHVNKVYHDDAANIAQAQLAGYFFGCFQVCFYRVLLLVVAYAFIAAVYINYMQCFCVLNYKVRATVEVYRFTERAFTCFVMPYWSNRGSGALCNCTMSAFSGAMRCIYVLASA